MLEKTTHDVALVPALRPAMEAFADRLDAAADVILRGRPERGARRRCVRAALAFETWRSLIREQRLSSAEAIDLMAGHVGVAARDLSGT